MSEIGRDPQIDGGWGWGEFQGVWRWGWNQVWSKCWEWDECGGVGGVLETE